MANYRKIVAQQAAQDRYRNRHRIELNLKGKLRARKSRAITRQWMIAFKSNKPCLDCKQIFPWYIMQFDHRDPTTKIAPVSQLARTTITQEYLLKEIKKCDLVCANCHAIRTYQRRQHVYTGGVVGGFNHHSVSASTATD